MGWQAHLPPRRVRQSFAERIDRLTRRQRHILVLVLKGQTSRQIAHTLGRSIKTVEMHGSQILHRMKVHNVAEVMNVVFNGKPAPVNGNGAR